MYKVIAVASLKWLISDNAIGIALSSGLMKLFSWVGTFCAENRNNFVLLLSWYNFLVGDEYGLKQEDALYPLLFNLSLEYAVKKLQETNLGWLMANGHYY